MLSVILIIVACLANVVLAVAVLLNNSRATLNRVYASLVTVTAAWSAVVYLEDTSYGRLHIQMLAQLDYILATMMIGFFLWFCRTLVRHKSHLAKYIGTIVALSNVLLIGVGLTVQVEFNGADTVFQPQIGFALFVGYLVVAVPYGMYLLWHKYRQSHGMQRIQLKYIGLGLLLTVLTVVLGTVIVPRVFGISSPELTRSGLYGTLFFSGFSMYAIMRHRFMDLRFLVARSAAYLLLLMALAGIYGLGIFATSLFFFKNATNTLAQSLTYTVLSVVLAFTFQPMRRFFERVTDNVFYRDRYDSQKVLNKFSQILVSELHLDRILKKALTGIGEDLHIQFAQVVVYNSDRVYRIEHYGPLPRRLMVAPELAKLNRPMLVADELGEGERKDILDSHGIRVSLTLRTREEFVGYLLLGDKLSGDIYSSQDLEVLEIIGKELAVAILNAKSYAEIQAFNLTLQARVDHATKRLRVANRHLKELDRAKDEFISMASHQLRTPLTTIKGYLSMMLEGDAGKLTKAQTDFVGYAFGSSERMVNLISDLLNVSRLSAGRFLIQAKPTDMVRIIDDEVRQLQTHATAKGIKLIFEHPVEVIEPVEIDDNKTRQVIMNFIDNAIYYTTTGSVTVVLQQAGSRVRFEVRDTGIGVPHAARRKLFSKFYRAENAQVIRPDGTGLGLYLAKRVIEDQGGTIIFESVEGQGSTFGFELPNHHEELIPPKRPSSRNHARPKP